MVREKPSKWRTMAFIIGLALLAWALPAKAQLIGDWSGYFANLSGPDYFDHALDVPQDGSVTLVTTVASTFLSQFSGTNVLDQNGDTIDFTILMTSPKTLVVPLAAGSYVVRIGRGEQNKVRQLPHHGQPGAGQPWRHGNREQRRHWPRQHQPQQPVRRGHRVYPG